MSRSWSSETLLLTRRYGHPILVELNYLIVWQSSPLHPEEGKFSIKSKCCLGDEEKNFFFKFARKCSMLTNLLPPHRLRTFCLPTQNQPSDKFSSLEFTAKFLYPRGWDYQMCVWSRSHTRKRNCSINGGSTGGFPYSNELFQSNN